MQIWFAFSPFYVDVVPPKRYWMLSFASRPFRHQFSLCNWFKWPTGNRINAEIIFQHQVAFHSFEFERHKNKMMQAKRRGKNHTHTQYWLKYMHRTVIVSCQDNFEHPTSHCTVLNSFPSLSLSLSRLTPSDCLLSFPSIDCVLDPFTGFSFSYTLDCCDQRSMCCWCILVVFVWFFWKKNNIQKIKTKQKERDTFVGPCYCDIYLCKTSDAHTVNLSKCLCSCTFLAHTLCADRRAVQHFRFSFALFVPWSIY